MLKDILKTQIAEAAYLYGKDLEASNDAIMACCSGKARTPNEFTTEAAGFNMLCSKMISGKEMGSMQDEYGKIDFKSYDTKDKSATFFRQSVDALTQAVDGASDEDLHKQVTAPWGETMPAYKMALTAVWHMMYHDGQLNLVQLQNGDDKVHWMPG